MGGGFFFNVKKGWEGFFFYNLIEGGVRVGLIN
jgi:hypothetical protein